jgi:hypothetical protein
MQSQIHIRAPGEKSRHQRLDCEKDDIDSDQSEYHAAGIYLRAVIIIKHGVKLAKPLIS